MMSDNDDCFQWLTWLLSQVKDEKDDDDDDDVTVDDGSQVGP